MSAQCVWTTRLQVKYIVVNIFLETFKCLLKLITEYEASSIYKLKRWLYCTSNSSQIILKVEMSLGVCR